MIQDGSYYLNGCKVSDRVTCAMATISQNFDANGAPSDDEGSGTTGLLCVERVVQLPGYVEHIDVELGFSE